MIILLLAIAAFIITFCLNFLLLVYNSRVL